MYGFSERPSFPSWDQLANKRHIIVVNVSKMTTIHHHIPCDSFRWHHLCKVSAFELMMTSSWAEIHDTPLP